MSTTESNSTETKPARIKAGRPTKYSEAIVKEFCDAIADGTPITHAACIVGVDFQTVCTWRRRFPEFEKAIQKAVSRGIRARLAVVKKAMNSKDEGIALRAATWWLTHARPASEHFAEHGKIEVTGDDIKQEVTVLVWPHQLDQPKIEKNVSRNHIGNGTCHLATSTLDAE